MLSRCCLPEDGPSIGSGSGGEFNSEWFDGGEARMSSLKNLEGEKAPPIKAIKWLGDPAVPEDRDGRVTVVRFVFPDSVATRRAMPGWKKTAQKLGPQGVVFIGICDHLADWKLMEALMRGKKPPFPIGLDALPDKNTNFPTWCYGNGLWHSWLAHNRGDRSLWSCTCCRYQGCSPRRSDRYVDVRTD